MLLIFGLILNAVQCFQFSWRTRRNQQRPIKGTNTRKWKKTNTHCEQQTTKWTLICIGIQLVWNARESEREKKNAEHGSFKRRCKYGNKMMNAHISYVCTLVFFLFFFILLIVGSSIENLAFCPLSHVGGYHLIRIATLFARSYSLSRSSICVCMCVIETEKDFSGL